MIMTFSDCERCCQMPLFQSPTLMTETKLKSAHEHNWDDQRWNPNSWKINHMLGDIMFGTQFLVTHLVTTFSVGDNHDSPKQQNKHSYSLCLHWLSVGSNRAIKLCSFCFLEPLASTAITRDYRDDHRQKMSRPSNWPRVGCAKCHRACDDRHQLLESHLWSSQ